MIRDASSEYPVMLPTSTQFAKYMTELGVRPDDVLVFYDAFEQGIYFSPRAAWTCRHFGHKAVHVLNNFPRYVEEGFPVSTGELSVASTSTSQPGYPEQPAATSNVVSFEELRDMINAQDLRGRYQIIDARPSDRFSGTGHMPSAVNVPFSSILGPDKLFLPPAELKELLTKAGVKEHVPTVLSCNSGVTATALDFALRTSGLQVETRLYDGSWSEWAKRANEDGLIVKD